MEQEEAPKLLDTPFIRFSYAEYKAANWKKLGFLSPDESEYQKEQRETAQRRMRNLSYRVTTGSLSRRDAIAIVTELVRVTRSPSKRPVYVAWLKEETEVQIKLALEGITGFGDAKKNGDKS